MSDQDKKIVGEQEKLLDHIIEYGGRQYIDDEIKKCEDIPELEPSKEFDEKMNRMFKDAYKKEARKENMRFGKKIAVILLAVVGVGSAAAMNIQAVREPVLNFVFNKNSKDKTKINITENSKSTTNFIFKYMPHNYKFTKKQYLYKGQQIIYKYTNTSKNDYIYINIQLDEKYENYINQSSSKKYEELNHNNHKYYFLEGSQNTLMTYKSNSIITITSTQPQSQLIKIAENIKMKK